MNARLIAFRVTAISLALMLVCGSAVASMNTSVFDASDNVALVPRAVLVGDGDWEEGDGDEDFDAQVSTDSDATESVSVDTPTPTDNDGTDSDGIDTPTPHRQRWDGQ